MQLTHERFSAESTDVATSSRVLFDDRDYPEFKVAEINPQYGQLINEFRRVYSHGDLGNFQPLPRNRQDIPPEIGRSRKLHVGHPLFPDKEFVLGGIGLVKPSETGLVVQKPRADLTLRDELPNLAEKYFGTMYVSSNGEDVVDLDRSPLGGYKPNSAKNKYDNTKLMYELLENCPFAKGYEPVACGELSENLGWIVYAFPLDSICLTETASKDWLIIINNDDTPILDLLWQVSRSGDCESVYKTERALNYINRNLHRVHNQLHRANVRMHKGEPILGDWETLQNICDYPIRSLDGENWPPKTWSMVCDLQHSLDMLSSYYGFYGLECRLACSISGMLGYWGKDFDDRIAFEEVFNAIIFDFIMIGLERNYFIQLQDHLFKPSSQSSFDEDLDAHVSLAVMRATHWLFEEKLGFFQ